MKKTNRNQNMPDYSSTGNESANKASLTSQKNKSAKPERFINANLDHSKDARQRYDDQTGTVENGIG